MTPVLATLFGMICAHAFTKYYLRWKWDTERGVWSGKLNTMQRQLDQLDEWVRSDDRAEIRLPDGRVLKKTELLRDGEAHR